MVGSKIVLKNQMFQNAGQQHISTSALSEQALMRELLRDTMGQWVIIVIDDRSAGFNKEVRFNSRQLPTRGDIFVPYDLAKRLDVNLSS